MKTIPLPSGHEVLVDDEDFPELIKYRWRIQHSGYAIRNAGQRPHRTSVLLHHHIMKPPAGLYIDHRNGNKLDNRRSNLRLCTRSQNYANRGKQSNNTGPYKGAHYHRGHRRWEARIQAAGTQYYLGQYNTAAEAARAYNDAALRYHGEFAWLNPIEDTP